MWRIEKICWFMRPQKDLCFQPFPHTIHAFSTTEKDSELIAAFLLSLFLTHQSKTMRLLEWKDQNSGNYVRWVVQHFKSGMTVSRKQCQATASNKWARCTPATISSLLIRMIILEPRLLAVGKIHIRAIYRDEHFKTYSEGGQEHWQTFSTSRYNLDGVVTKNI